MEREPALRQRLVEHLERAHVLTDANVRAALLTVSRQAFVPEFSLEDAYDDRALATKERDGMVISSISQPGMIVQMLQLLAVRRGDRVLEIGTGTGYNAALLAALAGDEGAVVTVDIERDLVEGANATFAMLRMSNIRAAEARELPRLDAPFDRIIVTARADDIETDWWRLLSDGGRIVVPLDLGYGGERAIGFTREGFTLRSVGGYACAFLEMRGERRGDAEIFFPNRAARYAAEPHARVPMQVRAAQRSCADDALARDADVVIARPETVFALRFL